MGVGNQDFLVQEFPFRFLPSGEKEEEGEESAPFSLLHECFAKRSIISCVMFLNNVSRRESSTDVNLFHPRSHTYTSKKEAQTLLLLPWIGKGLFCLPVDACPSLVSIESFFLTGIHLFPVMSYFYTPSFPESD